VRWLLWAGLLGTSAWADSPLTEVVFWKAYRDVPQVVLANDLRRLNTDLGNFLLSGAPLDQKAALINALSWSAHWQENAILFRDRLQEKYATAKLDMKLSASESFCLGYLEAMDRHQDPAPALPNLHRARQAFPKSYTVLLVDRLVRSQLGEKSPKAVWLTCQPLFQDASVVQDLRPLARQSAYRILANYRDFCPPSQRGTEGVDRF
jgi:hypothetical protein